MNSFFYKNRKKTLALGVVLLLSGVYLAFQKWGIEPQETLAGVLCGLGLGIVVISLSIKRT